MNWFIKAVLNTWDFSGRSCRKEFWYYQLVLTAIILVGVLMDYKFGLVQEQELIGPFTIGISILSAVTNISIIVRRLHDTGLSGFWTLLIFVPLGNFILIAMAVRAGDENENKYGPPPHTSLEHNASEGSDPNNQTRFDA